MSVFLVTGATGTLGEATVRALSRVGHRLLLTGRNAARLAELENDYGATTLQVDATTPEGAQFAAAEAVRRFGELIGLVHLVGQFTVGPLMLTDESVYEETLWSNFLSAVVATQAVLPHLTEGGRLVYFSIPLVREPLAALSAYAASKAALITWMRSMAHEVKRRGIHANAIELTMLDGPELRAERPNLDFDHVISPELVARAVEFLVGPGSDGMYGATVPLLGKFSYGSVLAGGSPPAVGARR